MLTRGCTLRVFQQARLIQQLFTGRLHILKGGVGNGPSGDAHDIPARDNVIPAQPHRLPHQPPHSIAFDGVADALAGCESESAVKEAVWQDNQDDQGMLGAASLASDLLKTFFIPKAILPAHGNRQKIRRSGACGRADDAV